MESNIKSPNALASLNKVWHLSRYIERLHRATSVNGGRPSNVGGQHLWRIIYFVLHQIKVLLEKGCTSQS